jgi:hypothetical protein
MDRKIPMPFVAGSFALPSPDCAAMLAAGRMEQLMSLPVLMFVQAAAAAAAPPAGPLPIDFDLARYRPADAAAGITGCGGGPGGPEEVVVCGRRRQGGDYPMAAWTRIFATRPLVAEIGIAGDMRGDVHVESAALDRGAVSNRVMVRVKWPF